MSHAKDRSGRPEAILIAGPTASGKSGLALRLARRIGGLVVNADSMQVYRDLRILTARPSEDDMDLAPHALYGTVDGATSFSVNAWLAEAAALVRQAPASGKIPIFVGGTGLYFKALTQGLSPIPDVPDAVRQQVRKRSQGLAPETLHAELARCDPTTAARLRPSDPQRVLRALEVFEATGVPLASFHERREAPAVALEHAVAVSLDVGRSELRRRVDRRFEAMVTDGALEEVAALDHRRLDPALPVMRAIGVPQLIGHRRGTSSLAQAVADAQAATRQYIKRQETFLRHQLPTFRHLAPEAVEAWLATAYSLSE